MRFLPVCALSMALSTPAWAAFDVFLDFPGIPGASLNVDYRDQIEILSMGLDAFRVAEVGDVANASAPKLAEVKVVKQADQATPALMLAAMNSTPATEDAVFSYVRSGAVRSGPPFLIVTLKRATVTGYRLEAESGSDVPVETVTIAYDTLCISQQPTNPQTGNPDGPLVTRCWDADANAPTSL